VKLYVVFFPKQEYSIHHSALLAILFLHFYTAVAMLAVLVYEKECHIKLNIMTP